MILGAIGGRDRIAATPPGFTLHAADVSATRFLSEVYRHESAGGALAPAQCLASDAATGSWLAFSGNPIMVGPAGDLARGDSVSANRLLAMLASDGRRALERLDGQFAIAWWNARDGRLTLIRDRFGMEPLCFSQAEGRLVFGSRARDVAVMLGSAPAISMQGLVEFLTYCYLPGEATLFAGIERVPPGSIVEFSAATGTARTSTWYRLSFAEPLNADEAEIATRYRALLEASVVRRLSDTRTGVFLSGGMDSSSVATFARKHLSGDISSFSFRCIGASFDESPYARELARQLGTRHTEVDFGEQQSLEVAAAVAAMDMPFCDVGIEIGTWLLAKAARSNVDYLLTGDGGDELWASHPVYAAQKIMRWYDRMPIPRALRGALVRSLALVKDSDKKRNLPVVLKRILPEPAFPNDLKHFRWRMYYTFDSMRALLAPALTDALRATDPFRPVTDAFADYQGPDDGLSPCLYSDYRSVSSFYFSRLFLARSFGLETRLPFYDRDLVEFGARIPAHLKLEGVERTKRLFRVAMEGVLPDIINHRKDKLGHSVPFKNWLRERGPLSEEVAATLSSASFVGRDLFRQDVVAQMLEEHRARRHNHSHRIWALFLLEHWFRRHFDTASVTSITVARSRAA
jgi:asparagine synthase (glutamine-hydrolysing)